MEGKFKIGDARPLDEPFTVGVSECEEEGLVCTVVVVADFVEDTRRGFEGVAAVRAFRAGKTLA